MLNRQGCYNSGEPITVVPVLVLPSDWAEKHKSFLAPIRSQNGGDRLELVW